MKLLLDTHVVLWWLLDDRRLSRKARSMIESLDNRIAVSAASLWETAVKEARSKTSLKAAAVLSGLKESGFDLMPITAEHAVQVSDLPPHHGDPFDRMLVAQARHEGCALVTRDRALSPYAALIPGDGLVLI